MTTNSTTLRRLLSPVFSGFVKCNFLIISILLLQSAQAGSTISLDNAKKSQLPVFNTELSIEAAGQNLIISWQADKATINYYEVEKSTDGEHFSTIGLVLDVLENSNLCMFKDKKLTNTSGKTVWYRIKAIDKDGGMLYSNSSSFVSEKKLAPACEATVCPNPFTTGTIFKFKSTTTGIAEIKVQNLDGQTLLSKQSGINKGYNSIGLEGLGSLTSGIYIARLTINGTVIGNQKLIKK